jgi:hypothetical protein
MQGNNVIIFDGRWEVSHRQLNAGEWHLRNKDAIMQKPFNLGFADEEWHSGMDCLVVPVPHTPYCILASRNGDGTFNVITKDKWAEYPDAIMAACVIQDHINLVTSEGNNGHETNTEA